MSAWDIVYFVRYKILNLDRQARGLNCNVVFTINI